MLAWEPSQLGDPRHRRHGRQGRGASRGSTRTAARRAGRNRRATEKRPRPSRPQDPALRGGHNPALTDRPPPTSPGPLQCWVRPVHPWPRGGIMPCWQMVCDGHGGDGLCRDHHRIGGPGRGNWSGRSVRRPPDLRPSSPRTGPDSARIPSVPGSTLPGTRSHRPPRHGSRPDSTAICTVSRSSLAVASSPPPRTTPSMPLPPTREGSCGPTTWPPRWQASALPCGNIAPTSASHRHR